MSLTLTSGIQAQKDALSKAPVWVLKIEFATGTLYVGSQTLTIVAPSGGADWVLTPWVISCHQTSRGGLKGISEPMCW